MRNCLIHFFCTVKCSTRGTAVGEMVLDIKGADDELSGTGNVHVHTQLVLTARPPSIREMSDAQCTVCWSGIVECQV